jgi:Ca2+/Na+ antiporter
VLTSRDAFIKAVGKIQPHLWKLTFFSIGLVALAGFIGGLVISSGHTSPDTSCLIFLFGVWTTLAVAIPLTLCVFLGVVFVYGFILFLWFRFRAPKV